MDLHDVSNLNYRVRRWLRELAGLRCTLNIEAKNAQWGNLRVFTVTRQALHMVVIIHIEFDLARCLPSVEWSHFPVALLNFDPCHATDFIVNHEAQRIQHIRFISYFCYAIMDSTLDDGPQLSYVLGMLNIYFEEFLRFVLVVHNRHFFTLFDFENRIGSIYLRTQIQLELLQLLRIEREVAVDLCVEIGCEVMHEGCHGVASLRDTEQTNDWLVVICLIYKQTCQLQILGLPSLLE